MRPTPAAQMHAHNMTHFISTIAQYYFMCHRTSTEPFLIYPFREHLLKTYTTSWIIYTILGYHVQEGRSVNARLYIAAFSHILNNDLK